MITDFNLEQQIAIAMLRRSGHPNPEGVVDQERMFATALISPLVEPLTKLAEAAIQIAKSWPESALPGEGVNA